MFYVQWHKGTETWVTLKGLKETDPADIAKYAVSCGIQDQPVFAWWVLYMLCKRDVIISAVTSRARKASHKYVIEIPTSVAHAKELDSKNDNTAW